MENSAMDSCKIGPAVRLFSSWHGSHAEAKPSHEKVSVVGRTERKRRELKVSRKQIQSILLVSRIKRPDIGGCQTYLQ